MRIFEGLTQAASRPCAQLAEPGNLRVGFSLRQEEGGTAAPSSYCGGMESRQSLASDPRFFVEVSFLNKVSRVFPRAGSARMHGVIAMVGQVLTQVLGHFRVKVDLVSSAHLVHAQTRAFLWSDEDLLHGESYFLCFARRGFRLTRASL